MLINVNQMFLMLHRLNNLKVTGGSHLGWGGGGKGKIIVKVTNQGQGHPRPCQGHFQGQI